MLACPVCECHVHAEEISCPHCGAAISTVAAPSSRLGALALMAGLGLFGCTTSDDVAEGGTTTMMGTTSSTTDPGTESSGTDTGTSTTTTTGDGDGDWAEEAAYGIPDIPCGEFNPTPVMVGNNAVTVDTESIGIYQTCGGTGYANLYAFTSPTDANFEVSLIEADFESPVVSLIGYTCEPVQELGCALPPETQVVTMTAGETVHIAIDANDGPVDGTATLVIAEMQP